MRWPGQGKVERPRIVATCCGRSDFAVGTPTCAPWFDGESVGVEHRGPVLCCAHCGAFYGLNELGLYAPHPHALPPQWAMVEERRRAIEAEIKRRADAPRDGMRELNGGRRAPKPVGRPRDPED